MDYNELIRSAFQSLRANALRTFLTMLGIIIGISAVILIFSIGQGAVAYVKNELSMFGTDFFQINPGNNAISALMGEANTVTMDDVNAIEKDKSITNIRTVGAFASIATTVTANDINKVYLIYGMSPSIQDLLKPNMVVGNFFTDEQNLQSQRVAVVGNQVADTFFGKGVNPLNEKMKIQQKTFKVIGVAKSGSVLFGGFFDNAIFIPIDVMLHEMEGGGRIREVDIAVYDTNRMNETIQQVTDLLRDRHNLKTGDENDFITASATDSITIVENITNILTLIFVGISAISLIVGGVGVMNIMLVSVTERTREIGLLKAIGAQEKDILFQFLIEAMVMTGFGGLLGIAVGIGGAALVSMLVKIPLVVSPIAILIAFGISMLVGVGFGMYPARRAARLSPIDALRYE